MYKNYFKGCRTVHQLDPRCWVDETLRQEAKAKLLNAVAHALATSKDERLLARARGLPARLAEMEAAAQQDPGPGPRV